MIRISLSLLLCMLPVVAHAADSATNVVTTGSLLREMPDLGRLARWPDPIYRTIQFSSYDRRSTTSEAPGWFSNADGFGREPIPGFMKVLREPGDGQNGLYLVAEVNGPGAIVRGWSAGMGGVMRVFLDGREEPVWEGAAYDFLARRSARYAAMAGLELNAGNAFVQEDADYLPIAFARSLRVTWEGRINELHFYHLQVRVYPEGTRVQTFDPKQDLRKFEAEFRGAVAGLIKPDINSGWEWMPLDSTFAPGTNWNWVSPEKKPGAVRELRLRLEADDLEAALRSCVLRLAFDGSQRPQVEAPVGDFFGSGPGVNPFSSLPLQVEPDGTMVCRFVMPYQQSVKLEIANFGEQTVRLSGSVRYSAWDWDDRSLYFRAKWRADHDLLAAPATMDLPYLVLTGKGVFAGCAAMIMNPSGVPTAGGNWWGEGDEKFLVDGEATPSTFGTGSEDYFNYSWSRSHLFDHPFCGQPLDSGPDTSGYVSNHRFQILDAIPFEKSFAALMELWTHRRTPGLSYARIAYHYARPGAVDDHRSLVPADLKIPALPKREPVAAGGASGAIFLFPRDLKPQTTAGTLETVPFRLATQLEVLNWKARPGETLRLRVPVEKAGNTALRLVAVHQPDGAVLRARLNGKMLTAENASETITLKARHRSRVLNAAFKPIALQPGTHDLVLECTEAGLVMLDYLWLRQQ